MSKKPRVLKKKKTGKIAGIAAGSLDHGLGIGKSMGNQIRVQITRPDPGSEDHGDAVPIPLRFRCDSARFRRSNGLPTWLSGLPRVTAIIILASAASALARATEAAVIRLGAGLVHIQSTPAEFLAIQRGNGLLRFAVITHLYESESARASRLAVRDHSYAIDVAEGLEKLAKIILRGAE
jgi:hypothetical protein